ncbi:MAG: Hsp20/alpha crystallin family protein [Ktedonobacteraceae bacterium]
MTAVRRFSPLSEALTLHDAMNQLFAQSYVQPTWSAERSSSLAVPIDVFESEETYHVHALLPGIAPEEIELTVQGNTLTFRGQLQSQVKPEQQVTWLAQEIASGSFERSITFTKPIDSERIETQYMNGLLMITVPLHESNRPKRIKVNGSEPKQVAVEAGRR